MKSVVDKWQAAIRLGLQYKDRYSDHKDWKEYRDYYRGEFGDGIAGAVNLNATFAYIKSVIPRVYFRTPSLLCVPRKPEFIAHAKLVESIDKWLIQETNLKKQLKSAILDTCLCGIGPIKLGFDSQYGYDEKQILGQDSSTVTQVSNKDGRRIEYNCAINPGMPWAQRTRPDQLITPYGYDSPDELPWIAQMLIRPLLDCKADTKYNNNRNNLVGGFSIPSTAQAFSAFNTGDSDRNAFVMLYEIRDLSSGKMIIMAEDKILYEDTDSCQVDGLPYEYIIFNEDPEHFWPLSDVRMFKPQQLELNDIRTHAKKQRALALVKILFKKGAISATSLERLLSGDLNDIMAGIEIDDEYIDGAVKPFIPSTNLQDLIREQERTESDMRSVMGFSQNQAGEFSPFHNKTAEESRIVETASAIRVDERRDVVADVLANIMRKWNQYVYKFWDQPRIAQITGNDGFQYWVKFTGEQIKGEYDLIIHPESGQPIDSSTRRQVASEMFQMFNNDPLIDQIGLRRKLMQQASDVDPEYETFIRPPQPNPAMNVSPNNPMDMDTLQSPEMAQQILGQPKP